MAELILHHYPMSPFAEKIRLILGYKKLSWQSVLIPVVMPKPDLTALTGGYRRTPVLQIGADIYCDTALIARVLEQLAPSPSLLPSTHAGLAASLAQWADRDLFWTLVTWAFQPAGAKQILGSMPAEMAQAFKDDRAALRGNTPQMSSHEAAAATPLYLQRLEQMLQHGQEFLFGGEPCLADFACYHPLWFMARIPAVAAPLQERPNLLAWMARMKAIGHHTKQDMTAEDALAVARNSQPLACAADASSLHGIALGDMVSVMPADYGFDPVQGELVVLLADQIGVRRSDPRAGTVVVHFPRIGYQIRRAV